MMKNFMTMTQMIKLFARLGIQFVHFHISFRKAKNAFREELVKRELPSALIDDLVTDYTQTKTNVMTVIRSLSSGKSLNIME